MLSPLLDRQHAGWKLHKSCEECQEATVFAYLGLSSGVGLIEPHLRSACRMLSSKLDWSVSALALWCSSVSSDEGRRVTQLLEAGTQRRQEGVDQPAADRNRI